ncbi:class I SAM-dependent methyltransferase [Frankia sp. ACN1ag]|uniref:SAM-dependent methyltransferase n=1 Tax=Frankia sp. ACN1ag TaxID=102891 RepID=UPI0006DBF099|nr:class I SAM-dependent methyltransferase [Frankia sp. ACN1ag]KQC35917.1 SAM-dependent methyltransferase [Frankia sp. ACN1ag]
MTLPPQYFDEMYAGDGDPWGFADRWYERRKRALTVALLPDDRYATGYEPGCSIGLLTRDLAGRCGRLLATDVAPAAVSAATRQTADLPNVRVEVARLPGDWPTRTFELVVLSEVGYYFDRADARLVAARATASAGTLVAVHWRHPVEDYPCGGDEVHALLGEAAAGAGLTRLVHHLEDDLVADVWARDARSVAARTGLR